MSARLPPRSRRKSAAALARIPKQPLFSPDFEISHGVSTLTDAPNFLQPGQSTQISGEPSVARYVRIRREFSVQALFSSVQYSFSNDGQNMVETLVLHVRDPERFDPGLDGRQRFGYQQRRHHGRGQHSLPAASGSSVLESRRWHWPAAVGQKTARRRIKARMSPIPQRLRGARQLSSTARRGSHSAGGTGPDPQRRNRRQPQNQKSVKPKEEKK